MGEKGLFDLDNFVFLTWSISAHVFRDAMSGPYSTSSPHHAKLGRKKALILVPG